MITGTLKTKIDALWQNFYNHGQSEPTDVVNQLTMLMFVKMLDDRQIEMEKRANILAEKIPDKDLIFKSGNYVDEENHINVPYQRLRWSFFKNLNGAEMMDVIRNCVFPFIRKLNAADEGPFTKLMADITFGITSVPLLTATVDGLSDPEINFSDTDLMGDFYEYLLTEANVSGQFRTPRHIIDLIVEMVAPKLGDRIIDPAMGTAGFLTESAKYIKAKYPNDLIKVENRKFMNEEMFTGVDTDHTMARIGTMNLALHGISKPSISMDSLLEKGNADPLYGKFDVVLANPPFSGNLDYPATDGKILATCRTKKTELLFIALYLKLLKVGGIAASIVPDGVLFGSDKAHLGMRQELIEHQKILAVVSLPSGVFMPYSNVKTSFIIFQKTNCGGGDKIWFASIENDGFSLDAKRTPIAQNDIPSVENDYFDSGKRESKTRFDDSFLVPFEEIKNCDYDLSFNRYKKVQKKQETFRPASEILANIDEINKTTEADVEELEKAMKESKK
jgi:type I restriction enzyme M protein